MAWARRAGTHLGSRIVGTCDAPSVLPVGSVRLVRTGYAILLMPAVLLVYAILLVCESDAAAG